MNFKAFNFFIMITICFSLYVFLSGESTSIASHQLGLSPEKNSIDSEKMSTSDQVKVNLAEFAGRETEDEIVLQMNKMADEYKDFTNEELRSEINYLTKDLRRFADKNHIDFDQSELKLYNLQVRKKVVLQKLLFNRKYSERKRDVSVFDSKEYL